MFVAFTGQIIALQDLRGAYAMRIAILAAMMLIAAGAVVLGVSASGSVTACVLGMWLIAVLNGLWRHLSADYGPPMAVSSALLFLLGTAQHGTFSQAVHLAGPSPARRVVRKFFAHRILAFSPATSAAPCRGGDMGGGFRSYRKNPRRR